MLTSQPDPSTLTDKPEPTRPTSRLERLLRLAGDPVPPREDCLPPEPVRAALAAADRPALDAAAHARAVAATVVAFTAAFLVVAGINLALPQFGRLESLVPTWDYTGPVLALVLVLGGGLLAFAASQYLWRKTAPAPTLIRSAGLVISMVLAVLSVIVLR